MAFNANLGEFWASAPQYSPIAPSNGNYIGNYSTTLVNGTTLRGEWLQIDLPEVILLQAYSLQGRQDSNLFASRMPRDFVLLGSIDGTG